MGLILTWCGAIAACWQLQKSPHESPPEGGASIRPHDHKHPLYSVNFMAHGLSLSGRRRSLGCAPMVQ